MNLQEMHYKQCAPDTTVNLLQSKLKDMGVEVEETWQEESSIGTYSLRLEFKGTHIGTNGKGVSKSFARASAYAEFFERYQNDILGPRVSFGNKFSFFVAPDEKLRTAWEISSDENAFINQYFKMRGLYEKSTEEKANAFYAVQKVDYLVYGLDNQYVTLPFYSIKQNSVVYLPKSTYTPFYGSNGMCAGNSPEEALVQGLSEIIERVVQRKIFIEKPTLPDIPEEYIKQYPYVYNIIQKLKEKEKSGYKFFIKDCSFGGKYPVAALIVYEVNSGKYGIKLGCHPDLGVAIERTLTEATQGQDLDEYSKRSIVDFANQYVSDWKNIYNSFKFGMGQFPYQLFGGKPTYEFTPVTDVSHLDNATILKNWISSITAEGYDIMVRNVSWLGFPSYHIIIPGLSEMLWPDDMKFRATNTRYYISHLLRDTPEDIDSDNSKLIIATMDYFLGNAYENTMESYYGVVDPRDIPCENIHCGCAYMIAMCHAMRGEYNHALKKMDFVMNLAERGVNEKLIDQTDYSFLLAVRYYIAAMSQLHNHSLTMEYLVVLFDSKICKKIDEIFNDSTSIISKQYPGVLKDGINNRDRYLSLYNAISHYTYALRIVQASTILEQANLRSLFL